MKIGTWRDSHPFLFNTFFEGEGGSGGGGGAGNGGNGGGDGSGGNGGGNGAGTEKKDEKTVPESRVNEIVQERVGEAKRKAEKDLADALGVSIEEAKSIIKAKREADDKEKSEAQLAREAADREKAEAEALKGTSSTVVHTANVERALIRLAPRDLEGEALDNWLSMRAKLVDVEVGSDAKKIAAAVNTLKEKEPLLFGVSTERKPPRTDPDGKPPRKTGDESAYERGQKRAEAFTGSGGDKTKVHPLLQR